MKLIPKQILFLVSQHSPVGSVNFPGLLNISLLCAAIPFNELDRDSQPDPNHSSFVSCCVQMPIN